jgi:biotin/methionine sulfoxide reductase
MSKLTEPVGEALSDHEIFRHIAAHMDLEAAFTEGRDEEGWLRWLWDESRHVVKAHGFSLPDYETFRKQGRVDVPESFETRVQKRAFVTDPVAASLKTESGKITIFNAAIDRMDLNDCHGHPTWMPPKEWLGEAEMDELHLISGQPPARLHSQLDSGKTAAENKIAGREPCLLHPETAARRGISEGDIVLISNQRGACLAGVRFSAGIRNDCIALSTGAWFDPQAVDGRQIEVHGNPNVLTIDKGASELSQGNISHTALVRIERWDKPLPEISVHRQPLFVTEN